MVIGSRGRRGWTPLAYPSKALVCNSKYFPLHPAVMLAVVRELLLLDGTIEPSTLYVNLKPVLQEVNASGTTTDFLPRFHSHIYPEKYRMVENELDGTENKFEIQDGRRKKKRKIDVSHQKKPIIRRRLSKSQEHENSCNVSAEFVAQTIVDRSVQDCFKAHSCHGLDEEFVGNGGNSASRPPRKVSDSDRILEDFPLALINQHTVGPLEMSRFVDFSGKKEDGSLLLKVNIDSMPALIETSIATEDIIRRTARDMATSMFLSFSDGALRLLVGYKVPTISRAAIIEVLANYLFDVSHAMYAWEQTDRELANLHKNEADRDIKVRKMLFDDRAMQRLGGFHECSDLKHAISIQRLSEKGISWGKFAGTQKAKVMFKHHESRSAILAAGQLRRGHRLRQKRAKEEHCTGRKRSMSNASTESCTLSDDSSCVTTDASFLFAGVPSAFEVRIVRSPGASWGVTLSKEGNVCIVERGMPQSAARIVSKEECLCSGDLIVQVTGEDGRAIVAPLFAPNKLNPDWFKQMVTLFKTSNELSLVIQRIGH